jgi:hypothetical protein
MKTEITPRGFLGLGLIFFAGMMIMLRENPALNEYSLILRVLDYIPFMFGCLIISAYERKNIPDVFARFGLVMIALIGGTVFSYLLAPFIITALT